MGSAVVVAGRVEKRTRVEVEGDGVEFLSHGLRVQVGQVGERGEGRLDEGDVSGLVQSVRCVRGSRLAGPKERRVQ